VKDDIDIEINPADLRIDVYRAIKETWLGGRPSKPLQERLFSFEFPESPGALLKFLHTLGTHWNISLFHYRSHGTDYGRVLAAFELGEHEPDFETRLNELGYDCHDETHNPAFRFFLAG
jgi:threonine dehydratase